MKSRNRCLCAVALAGLCFAAAAPDEGASPANQIDCTTCMFLPGAIPRSEICPLVEKWKLGRWETYRTTGAFAIAVAENPQLKEYLLNGTDGFWFVDEYIQDENYRSQTHYSFARMSFMRNDFGATEKSVFLVKYSYPLAHPDQWTGIYLYPGRRYVIVAYDWDKGRNAPVLHMACELTQR